MKRPASIHDPLEETMENPDLPPLALVPGSSARAASRSARRSLRRVLMLGAFLLVGVFAVLRLVSA